MHMEMAGDSKFMITAAIGPYSVFGLESTYTCI